MEHNDTWQVTNSHIVFEHPRLKLVEDTVRVPTGEQVKWLRFDGGSDSVGLVCLDQQRRILLARQFNYIPGRIVYEFPGGGIELNESLTDAARRELVEEVGLYPHQLEPLGSFLVNHRRALIQQHVFVATEFEERPYAPDVGEIIEFEWVSIDAIEAMIRAGQIENMFVLAIWTLFKLKHETYFTIT